MEVHIGSLIKARAKLLRVGPTELGSKIETSKQNVYGIFRRQSIDTELLHRISVALEHDFFKELSQALALELSVSTADQELQRKRAVSSREEDLARENAYLRRLNGLLEQQLGGRNLPHSLDL
jgi:hypothetical protein